LKEIRIEIPEEADLNGLAGLLKDSEYAISSEDDLLQKIVRYGLQAIMSRYGYREREWLADRFGLRRMINRGEDLCRERAISL